MKTIIELSESIQYKTTTSGCPSHGVCCECIAYHNRMGEFPACLFLIEAEATWDRSLAMLKKYREN